MKVIDGIARILKTEGAEFLSAYPTTPLIEAAAKAEIRPVLCRQERVGVGIADGISRSTYGKRIGVFSMQGGPGVFKGDLYFYKLDGDIRGRVAQIDTRKCPLFLLSGEYDYSCTPEETLAVAESIPGCEVTIMKGLGHFPMSENAAEFLRHLMPVLEKIASR